MRPITDNKITCKLLFIFSNYQLPIIYDIYLTLSLPWLLYRTTGSTLMTHCRAVTMNVCCFNTPRISFSKISKFKRARNTLELVLMITIIKIIIIIMMIIMIGRRLTKKRARKKNNNNWKTKGL